MLQNKINQTIKLKDGQTLGFAEFGDPKGKPIFEFHGNPSSRLGSGLFDESAKKMGIRIIGIDQPRMEKVAWYEGCEAQLGILGTLVIIFLSPFLVWPVGKLIAKIRNRETTATKGSRRARRLALIVSGLNFIFLMTLLFGFGDLTLGVSPILQVALIIPIVTTLLTVVLVLQMLGTWYKRYWSVWGRIFYSLISLAAVVFVLFAAYWNLLGWRF